MIKIIFLVLFLISCGNIYGMTLKELRSQIRLLVRDTNTDTTKQRWRDTLLNDRLNLAQEDFILRTRCLEIRYWIDTTTGTKEYPLPSNSIVVERAAYSVYSSTYGVSSSTAGYKKMTYVSIPGKDKESTSWEVADKGNPTEYYIRGSSIIGLHPTPTHPYAGTQRLQLDCSVKCSSMSADGNVPFANNNQLYVYHQTLIWYVVTLCKYDEGYVQEGNIFMNMYLMNAEFCRRDILNIPDRFGQQIKFGKPD